MPRTATTTSNDAPTWMPLRGDVTVYWPVATLAVEVEMRRPDRQPDGSEWPTPVWTVRRDGAVVATPMTLLTGEEKAYLRAHKAALVQVLAYRPPVV